MIARSLLFYPLPAHREVKWAGPAGGRPPAACRTFNPHPDHPHNIIGDHDWDLETGPHTMWGDLPRALALVWEGQPLIMGVAAFWRHFDVSPTALLGLLPGCLEGDPLPSAMREAGAVILLDSQRRETVAPDWFDPRWRT